MVVSRIDGVSVYSNGPTRHFSSMDKPKDLFSMSSDRVKAVRDEANKALRLKKRAAFWSKNKDRILAERAMKEEFRK